MKVKYLITTDVWFVAPDGNQYKSAWGDVEILEDAFLGIKTNRNSSNWYAKIGSEDKHIIIAGCQIHYAVKCKNKPSLDGSLQYDSTVEKYKEHKTPNLIYIAE